MIQYEWGFPSLEVEFDVDGLTNVVKTVHWTYTASEGDFSAYVYGSVGVGSPDPATFTDYAELTKEQVTEWVEAALNVEEMKASLAGQIEAQKAPSSGQLPPPWN